MKHPLPETLVLASHNAGKIREVAALFAPLGVRTPSASAFGISAPAETGTSFAQNARQKAEHVMRACGQAALADDSGLEVDALGGDPGIYSARWAGPDGDFALAMRIIEEKLQAIDAQDRTARFVCALALAIPGQKTHIYEGTVEGRFIWPPRGQNGFGYDPVFQADGYETSFGEMDPDKKHAISHRANAFARLLAQWGPPHG